MHEPSISNGKSGQSLYLLREMTAGSLSCMTASVVTNPLDVLRIRHQMVYGGGNTFAAGNVMSTLKSILSESGWRGIALPGLSATILREAFYSSIRFGLYTRIKDGILSFKSYLHSDQNSLLKTLFTVQPNSSTSSLNFVDKLLAGMLTGSIGSAIANPIDLVKIRVQYEYGIQRDGIYTSGPMKGKPPTYSSIFNAFFKIWKQEGGINSWFRGVTATMARAGLLTGGQLASYESAKGYFKFHWDFQEGLPLHVICSVWSGIVAATFCAPADIVKTRLMCDKEISVSGARKYRGAIDCLFQIIKNEGLLGLFKGWGPSYLRLAPHFIISLPLNEWFRVKLGVGNL
jgi:hypothetical protein